jgi:hypothetical protein
MIGVDTRRRQDFLYYDRTGSSIHPVSYQTGTRGSFSGKGKRVERKLTTYFNIVLRLKMPEDLPLSPYMDISCRS